MAECRKSYTLTKEQQELSKKTAQAIIEKNSKYDFITCDSTFDAGVFFEPTDEELQEIESD